MFVLWLPKSCYPLVALFLLLAFGQGVAVHAQTACSIFEVTSYPQTAYPGQTTSIVTRVKFTCGPAYDDMWKVRVDLSNSPNSLSSSNSVQYVYASYANTLVNVTNTFTAPQVSGILTFDVNAYVIAQSSGTVVASWPSTVSMQILPGATVTETTTVTTPLPPTTITETVTSTTTAALSLSSDQLFGMLTVVFVILFVAMIVIRLRHKLTKKTSSQSDSLDKF